MSRNGKLIGMVPLKTYDESIGTEGRYSRKKIKGCICHDKEFETYPKTLG